MARLLAAGAAGLLVLITCARVGVGVGGFVSVSGSCNEDHPQGVLSSEPPTLPVKKEWGSCCEVVIKPVHARMGAARRALACAHYADGQ